MKILTASQIREADAYTIEHEPIASIDLMERAAKRCSDWLMDQGVIESRRVVIFCGMGNNGGDGLVIARLLAERQQDVAVYVIRFSDTASTDFKTNHERLSDVRQVEVESENDLNGFGKDDLLIDAIFGTGLTRPAEGLAADTIEAMNKSGAEIIAIDIPSGLASEGVAEGPVVGASNTLSFEVPKLAFMFPSNRRFVGNWHVLSIGLHPEFMKGVKTSAYYLTASMLSGMVQPRDKFAHKGTFGHALLVSGTQGKMGAAQMACKAALRSGAGLVSLNCPAGGMPIIQEALPEVMCVPDERDDLISGVPDLGPYNAIGVGPGIGTDNDTAYALKLLIQNTPCPLVIDADAINILGENKTWIAFVPPRSIYTPHPKEFSRMVGDYDNDAERLEAQLEFSRKNRAYLVLKGAHTCITTPDGTAYFNSTGNPGMATGGSGDVLTGIITGLMAQGYESLEAALLGVFLHGAAGDMAAEKLGESGLIATDIIDQIGLAIEAIGQPQKI